MQCISKKLRENVLVFRFFDVVVLLAYCSARHYKFISFLQKLRIQEILIIKGGYWLLMSNVNVTNVKIRESNGMVTYTCPIFLYNNVSLQRNTKLIVIVHAPSWLNMKLQPISLF